VIYLVIQDQVGHVVATMNDPYGYLAKYGESGKVGGLYYYLVKVGGIVVGETVNDGLRFGAIDVGMFDVYQTFLKRYYER
jgi:hypothetical protein